MRLRHFLFFSTFICTMATAQNADVPKSDGIYFTLVALERYCPTPDPKRTAAAEKYKLAFIAHTRAALAARNALSPRTMRALEDMERRGPPEEFLANFKAFFESATTEQLRDACTNWPQDIARIERERGAP
jgi:hypothetical protein